MPAMELFGTAQGQELIDLLIDPHRFAPAGPIREAALGEVPGLGRHLKSVDGLLQLRGGPVWLLSPYRVDVK